MLTIDLHSNKTEELLNRKSKKTTKKPDEEVPIFVDKITEEPTTEPKLVDKKGKKKNRFSRRDMPVEGDTSSHKCLDPSIIMMVVASLMLSTVWLLYAIC